jgi:uncharacterized protein YbbC (DUF1343 family)
MNKIFLGTVFFLTTLIQTCGQQPQQTPENITETQPKSVVTGAENYKAYLPLLAGKRIGIVTNQTGIISHDIYQQKFPEDKSSKSHHAVVDFLREAQVNITKIYAPEHGFRGTADAGEHIKDGKDIQTGLPIISLYGNNKKPSPAQLQDIDLMLFDLQDVGARFYTYISTLHYVMEACAEASLPLIILDRPNPNGHIIDGPVLDPAHKSFVGMHPIPVLHGMTIGEYAQMINGEQWLQNGQQCKITVIPCLHYDRTTHYSLPVRPSPNLPNDASINLYASLCFFEGTQVSVGRGTDKQFQIYGAPFLSIKDYSFVPKPNLGAKDPLHKGKTCYGEDLSQIEPLQALDLQWLIKAYQNTSDKTKFFNNFFIKLAGTPTLQKQIEAGHTQAQIKTTWQPGLQKFKQTRAQYLIY